MDVSQYLEIFIEESKEHLQSLNETLLVLEKSPEDVERINEVFRVAHTLKGMAGTMGFKRMNHLTHNMENVLSEIRNGTIKINPALLDVLFQCLDALEQYVEQITNTGSEGEEAYQSIIDELDKILENNGATIETPATVKADTSVDEVPIELSKPSLTMVYNEYEEQVILKAKEEAMFTYVINIQISETCVLKSARSFIIFRNLEELGEVIKSVPTVEDIEDEKFDFDFTVLLVSDKKSNEVKEKIENIAEISQVMIEEAVLAEKKDEANEAQSKADSPEKANSTEEAGAKTPKAGASKKPKTNRTVRVDIERLDNLMNLVSELIIVKNGLETVENDGQHSNEQVEYLERITTSLHDAVMKVRMVPVERVFNRFPRLIRDLSRKLNKKMELFMSGEETELDRTVIDEIGDPLVHLIRNAADHGLETPAERLKAGKDETGHIFLEAYQDGNNVVIEVKDNGNGINTEKIKAKAIEREVISREQADAMSDQDIIELLFKPSFSTAEAISDVSGRGVGLDVVKTKIEALGGDIEVKSELGVGSTFIIRLPLTLAIIQALMVQIGEEKYAIPLSTIRTIEDVKQSDVKYVQNEEVIHLRNKVIPIIHLKDLLAVKTTEDQDKDFMTVVIVNKGEKQAGFIVDSLIGQQEIVIKTLGKYLINTKLIAGATILGNGEVALILDVNSLL